MESKKWEIAEKETHDIVKTLLKNRGIKTAKDQKEFFSPVSPLKITLKDLNIDKKEVTRAIKRLKLAQKNKEKIFIYGDYDADGVCATAILWEALYQNKFNCLPYIPDRFKEGYGLNSNSVKALKNQNPNLKLIITVDNGIVAHDALKTAQELGIDVIVTDHHQKDRKKIYIFSVIHTTKISGSALSWIFAREVLKRIVNCKLKIENCLDLAAIGTIADQMPLLKENRSFVKFGLSELKNTKRKGLQELFKLAQIDKNKIGTYEVGFLIAPRINAMGRLFHAIDSLRLLCTKDQTKAEELARLVNKTNLDRQKIVDEVVTLARISIEKEQNEQVIIIDHESFHEGVIGLASSQITESFYKPSIVISKKGDVAKASARSIKGFNIIEAIRKLDHLIIEGGGHEMAAGFSIKKEKISDFKKEFLKISKDYLNDEILTKKLKIDTTLSFENINFDLLLELKKFEPTGPGNHTPLFATKNVIISDFKFVGAEKKHLKLSLKKDSLSFAGIAFNFKNEKKNIKIGGKIDIAYSLEENVWGNVPKIELKIKDLKINEKYRKRIPKTNKKNSGKQRQERN